MPPVDFATFKKLLLAISGNQCTSNVMTAVKDAVVVWNHGTSFLLFICKLLPFKVSFCPFVNFCHSKELFRIRLAPFSYTLPK
jgi:hypothetical protein